MLEGLITRIFPYEVRGVNHAIVYSTLNSDGSVRKGQSGEIVYWSRRFRREEEVMSLIEREESLTLLRKEGNGTTYIVRDDAVYSQVL